ncbi:MAG: TMEM165/GDT1 family protein, partial [Bdellovibrionaceae bacterium]|nr:TMEM165/GDT1 family protein [Pseudobdellovibrionaceae bacterium]
GSDLIGKTVLIAALLYSRHFDGLVYAPTRLCRYVSFVSRPQLSKISPSSTISVWLAVVLALALAGTIGVFFGKFLGQFINPEYLKYVSGGLFIVIGIYILIQKN